VTAGGGGPAGSDPGGARLVVTGPHRDGSGGETVSGVDGTVQAALLDLGLMGWSVPAVALGVPGILVIVVIALQLAGGTAWLPVARRVMSRTTRRPTNRSRRRPTH
jgi:hypothetical protein